jgi:tetratricopeptide (TPR) repeat protein
VIRHFIFGRHLTTLPALSLASLALMAGDASTSFRKALEHHKAGQLEAAVTYYTECLQQSPDWFEPRANLGAALAQLGRYKEATAEYKHLLAVKPENFTVRLNLALAYYKAGQVNLAVPELQTLKVAQPDNEQVTLLLGDSHFRLGEYAKVIGVVERLANDENLGAAYLMGTALIREGDAARGQLYIERIMKRGETPEAHLLLGLSQLRRQEYAEAAAHFSRALEMNPKLEGGHALLGQALSGTEDRIGARRAFEESVRVSPNDFDGHFYLGVVLKEERENEKALLHLKRAAELRPAAVKVPYQIGLVLLAAGRNDEARQVLEKVAAQAPDFVEGHRSLATAYYRLKRKEDGDRHRAIERNLAGAKP